MLSITVLLTCYSISGYLVLILLYMYNFRYVLVFSGIRVLMTWLCTIETYIWTFLYSNVFLSVSRVHSVIFLSSVYYGSVWSEINELTDWLIRPLISMPVDRER